MTESEMNEPRVTKRSEAVERAAAIGLIDSTVVPPPPDFYQSGRCRPGKPALGLMQASGRSPRPGCGAHATRRDLQDVR